jgi:hypothetical protein
MCSAKSFVLLVPLCGYKLLSGAIGVGVGVIAGFLLSQKEVQSTIADGIEA